MAAGDEGEINVVARDLKSPRDLALFAARERADAPDQKIIDWIRSNDIAIRFVTAADTVAAGTTKDYQVEVVDGDGTRDTLQDSSNPAFGVTVAVKSGVGTILTEMPLKPFVDGAATFKLSMPSAGTVVLELVDTEGADLDVTSEQTNTVT